MNHSSNSFNAPVQTLPVYAASGMRVTDGVNFGDQLTDARELVLDDIYSLDKTASQIPLTLVQAGTGRFVISQASQTGTPGNMLYLDCAITLMRSNSVPFEAVILVEVDNTDNTIAEIYLLPLAPLSVKTGYRLIRIDCKSAPARLAEAACVSFTRGTHITMADGQQCKIQDLRVGEQVLTRDNGMQTIRWIGQSTVRAIGEFAPVVIAKGTLGNGRDLAVSPNQRLFIYQQAHTDNASHSKVLVKAKHLVNNSTVTRQTGGFIDYFQLLFDDPQIVFAEGIATESLMLNERTSPALPKGLAQQIGHSLHLPHTCANLEVAPEQSAASDMAEPLRRASFI